mgnify:CR=1 FL=1
MGEVRRIAKPFFPWVGGKLFLLPYIFQLLPRRAPRLLEVCGGSGAVTLGLGAGYAPLRVYNDVDVDLVTCSAVPGTGPWRCSGNWASCPSTPGRTSSWYSASSTMSMTPRTTWRRSSRSRRTTSRPWTGRRSRSSWLGRASLPDVQRAAAYYLSIRYSYSATGNSFGGRSVELRRFLGLLRRASDALQGVVVENKDCCDVVRQYARPGAVIYADPPYLEAEKMYAPSFTLRDHVRLHDCLCDPAVRDSHIVLSYNSHPDILDLFAPDFYIVGFDRPNPMARHEDSRYHELLMTNFDPSPMLNRQLSLLELPAMESSDRPELRILSAPTGRLPRVWDWPQD